MGSPSKYPALLQSITSELSRIESSCEESCTPDSEPLSDVEISESEGEDVGEEEGESKAVRRLRGKFGRVNEKGETPLHQACIEGKSEKVGCALL